MATPAAEAKAKAKAEAKALVDHGCDLGRQGFYQSAIADFDRAIARDGSCLDAYYNRAVDLANAGELKKALPDLERVLTISPRAPDTRRLHALVLTRLGRWNGAIADYSVLIAAGDKNAADYGQRAALFAHIGDKLRAKADWRIVVQLDPRYGKGHLGKYDRYVTDDVAVCEQMSQFIGPGNWSELDKDVIAEVFCKVQRKAPGLVKRATNGQKLSFVFDISSDRTGMDSQSELHRILVHPDCFSSPPEKLEWILIHELVHQVDVSDYISCSKEFCSSAVPLIMRCRNSNRQLNWRSAYQWSGSYTPQPGAVACGLPTLYAATEPCETLAECTAAFVLYNWQPPSTIRRIINERVLAPESRINEEAALLSKAAVHHAKRDPKGAIAAYIKVLRSDDSCVFALTDLIACWNECGEPEMAISYARRALQVLSACNLPSGCETLADAYGGLGDAYYAQNHFRRALAEYSRSIAINPSYAAYVDRGACYLCIGNYKRAIADLRQALAFNPGGAVARSLLAEVPLRLVDHGCFLQRQGFYQSSIAEFDRAIARDAGCRDAYYWRAAAFERTGEQEKALHDLDRVFSFAPEDREARQLHALVLTELGRWSGAIRDYSVLIAAGDKDAADYAQRAALFAHIGDKIRAKADWRKVVQLDPKYAKGHLGKYNRYVTDDVAAFEKTSQFIGPGNWSELDKKVIAEVFCKVQKRAPGLVERATNGQKLSFVFSTGSDTTSGMESDSELHRVLVHPDCLSYSPETLEWTLIHELVHQVDVSEYISCSKKFCSSATPLIMRCRNSNRQMNWRSAYQWSGSSNLDPNAVACGLPTFYAATELRETLAECTAASVLCGWQPPATIQRIINERILAPEPKIDEEAALLREADVRLYVKGDPKGAIASYVKALRLDDACVFALVGLVACWKERGEPEIAISYSHQALRVLSACNPPSNCETLAYVCANLGDVYYWKKDFQRALAEYSRSIAIRPSSDDYVYRGECYLNIRDYKKAIVDFRQALALNPNCAVARSLLAEVHLRLRHGAQTR